MFKAKQILEDNIQAKNLNSDSQMIQRRKLGCGERDHMQFKRTTPTHRASTAEEVTV